MKLRFFLSGCLLLWGCSDGSESIPPNGANPTPPPAPAPVNDTPAEPVGPAPAIVILEKGTLNWPLGEWADGVVGAAVLGPTPGDDGAVRFSFVAENQHAEIYTHSHFDLTRGHESILLRAKASQPLSILVGIAKLGTTVDYWADLNAGHPWHVADVPLQTDWADLSIPISTMQAKAPGEPQAFGTGAPGSTLFTFLLENPGATDVWFEHIEIN